MAREVITILENLKNKTIFAHQLDPSTKKACCVFLLDSGKYTHQEISSILKISPSRVKQIKSYAERCYTFLVKEIDIERIVSEHMRLATRCKVNLAKQGDWKNVWNVGRELIEDLQNLGYLNRAPIEIKAELANKAKSWEELLGVEILVDDVAQNELINKSTSPRADGYNKDKPQEIPQEASEEVKQIESPKE